MENLLKSTSAITTKPVKEPSLNISLGSLDSNQNLKDSLMCPVCYEPYSSGDHDPLVLTCGHNICIRVLDKFYSNKKIKCP